MTVSDNKKEIELLKEISNKVTLYLFGNGEAVGLDEQFRRLRDEIKKEMTSLTNRMGVVESNTKDTQKMIQRMVGYAGVTYDEDNHPGRRESDGSKDKKTWLESAWEKTTENLFDKFVTAVIIIILVNIPDIFQKFLELAK